MNSQSDYIEIPGLPPLAGAGAARQSRLPAFIGARENLPAVLAALDLAVMGTGSLGQRIAEDFARLGINSLWLADYRPFKPESLFTHAIDPLAVGKPKASTVGERCKLLSPRTRVFAFDGPVQALPLTVPADVDLVVVATDNLAAEIEVGERCLRLRRPLVQAAVHGASLTAVVRFFGNSSAEGPCPRCLYGAAEEAALTADTKYSCEGQDQGAPVPEVPNHPTMTVASLCGFCSSLAGLQALRWAAKLGESVTDTLLEFNAYTHKTSVTKISRNPACPCPHLIWEVAEAPQELAECTVRRLVERALGQTDRATVTVDGFVWVESGLCQCPAAPVVGRFVAAGSNSLGVCARCGSALLAQPFFTHRSLPISKMGAAKEQPLRALGVVNPRAVLVRADARAVLFRNAGGRKVTC